MGLVAKKVSGAGEERGLKGIESSRHRARGLIQKYAGQHSRNAQQTKWIMDLVVNLDRHYREEIQSLRIRAEKAEGEQARVQTSMELTQEQHIHRNDVLEERLWKAEQRALIAEAKWSLADAELVHVQGCLKSAAAAAAAGCSEVAKLQIAFSELNQAEAQQKKMINTRSFRTKDELRSARGHIKDQRHKVKSQALELETIHHDAQEAIYQTTKRMKGVQELADTYKSSVKHLQREVDQLKSKIRRSPVRHRPQTAEEVSLGAEGRQRSSMGGESSAHVASGANSRHASRLGSATGGLMQSPPLHLKATSAPHPIKGPTLAGGAKWQEDLAFQASYGAQVRNNDYGVEHYR